jgi:hypothetical protein
MILSPANQQSLGTNMSMLRVFKATLPSVNYIFRNGKPAIFVNGRYTTEFPAEIEELEYEISLGHPHIYIDSAEREVDSVQVDPIAALTGRIRAQLVAEMAAATDMGNDMGKTEQGPLKPASSSDVAPAAAGAGPIAARLMSLGKH